ncbi:unnamed protein product [Dovyalis caffra]|uniref:CCHC-type domain-containing protein n=1 Tax=Dovyalis caffra TaxID=77055 RepID=A0AAV1RCX2_9ROSI|nr:unnamed protein product [Dovyalis caffra]
MKEGPARMMSKSMSFKSVTSGRSSTNESKVKMLSSKFSHIQDTRALKQVKDRNAVDRKNLLRLDRPSGSSMTSSAVASTPKVDQRLTPRGESAIASSPSNNRELKSAQCDGRLGTLSRSTSSVGRKGADIPVRASSTNGISSISVEQKLNQLSPKDEPSSSSSWNAERQSNNANENLQDGLSRSRESSNQGEKARESSVSRLRHAGTTGLKNVTCQKCKEIGHATENCTAVSHLASGTDASTSSRTVREEMSKGSKLKAAIEAAMLKKPGIYRKKKESDRSDGLSLSNVDASGEVASQDQFSVLNKMIEGTLEGQANLGTSSPEFCKLTNINNVKQLNQHSTDAVVTCQKCKEIGHATENCTVVSPLASGNDASTSRTAREEMSKGSKLKAAIEAAMLKKPGIYRKKKESDQSDGLSLSNADASGEIASQDQFSVLNTTIEGTLEGQANLGTSSELCKSTNINNMKQLNEHSTDAVCSFMPGRLDSIAPYLGKPAHASAEKSVLMKMSAIPEHEYGVFEVHRSEKFSDLYGGIQAHLSTCASPKVFDMVNKFPQKINLDEVPRLSTWPRQFHTSGAKEENIALYFFAKDFESYENYKGLLDSMIKKDLALKGSFDGVEFFIFPSTQLPENSQRWNMLYFLWGVFKGRASDCSDSFKKIVIPSLNVVPRDNDISAAVLSSSANLCASECIVNKTPACGSSCDAPRTSNVPDKPRVPLNGNSDGEVLNSHTILEKQNGKLDSKSLPKIPGSCTSWCPEIRCSSPPLEEVGLPECSLDVELKPCTEVSGTNSGSDVEEIQMHEGASRLGEDMPFKIFGVGSQDSGGKRTFCEEIFDRTYCDRNNVKVGRDLNEDNVNRDAEALSEKGSRKRPYLDLSETVPLTSSSMTQKTPWDKADDNKLVDGESIGKKLKMGFSGLYGGSGSRDGNCLSGSFTSQTCDLGSSSLIEGKSYGTASEEKVIMEDLEANERYFFPVDPHHVKDIQLLDNSMAWNSSNVEDRFRDGIPNLELALGAETKSPNKGILPFFGMVEKNNNQNKPPNKVMNKEEDDGVSASLSLSLSFPFPDKEQTVKPVPKTEQLVPERHHENVEADYNWRNAGKFQRMHLVTAGLADALDSVKYYCLLPCVDPGSSPGKGFAWESHKSMLVPGLLHGNLLSLRISVLSLVLVLVLCNSSSIPDGFTSSYVYYSTLQAYDYGFLNELYFKPTKPNITKHLI